MSYNLHRSKYGNQDRKGYREYDGGYGSGGYSEGYGGGGYSGGYRERNGGGGDFKRAPPIGPSKSRPFLLASPITPTSPSVKKNLTGSNPATGVNPGDEKFPQLSHHIEIISKSSKHRLVDLKKNYRVIYDPELDKSLPKGEAKKKQKKFRFGGEEADNIVVADPRLSVSSGGVSAYFNKPNKRSKKFPFKQLPQARFVYDKDSIGPEPATELVVWDLPSTVSEVYLGNFFKSYGGPISEIKFFNDPVNAVPLGIATFKFQGNIEKSLRLAKKLISVVKQGRIKIDGVDLKISLNEDKGVFLKSKLSQATKKLDDARRKLIEDEKKAEAKKRRDEQTKKKELQRELQKEGTPTGPAASRTPIHSSQLLLSLHMQQLLLLHGQQQQHDLPGVKKYSANTTILSSIQKNRVIPGVFMPVELNKYIKDRPHILIHNKYASSQKIFSQDIKKLFNKYDWTRVLSDKTGFYIVFNTLEECERCFNKEDGRRFYEFRLFMELAIPEGWKGEGDNQEENKGGERTISKNDVEEASNILIKEFQSFLTKDIRERVIAPAVFEFLNPERYPQYMEKLKEEEKVRKEVDAKKREATLAAAAATTAMLLKEKQQPTKLKTSTSLPSFRKKPEEKLSATTKKLLSKKSLT